MKNNILKTLGQKLLFDPAGQLVKVEYIFEGIFEIKCQNDLFTYIVIDKYA